jgi:hypothetical protein
VTTAVLVAALVALAVAALLSLRRARRVADRIEDGLRSPEPGARGLALDLLEEEGVAAHAGALLDAVRSSCDPDMAQHVRALVQRFVWEPCDSDALRDLRRWAAEGPPSCPTETRTAAAGVLATRNGACGASAGNDPAGWLPGTLVPRIEEAIGESVHEVELRIGDKTYRSTPARSRPTEADGRGPGGRPITRGERG